MADRLIDIQNTDVYFEVRNNRLNGLTAGLHGIFLANITHGTISENVIENSFHNGILIGKSRDIQIMNNWIFQHGFNGIQEHDSANITINGNIIYKNGYTGIWLRDNVKGGRIENNTIRDNNNYGLLLSWESLGDSASVDAVLISDNTFMRNAGGVSQAGDWTRSPAAVNIFLQNYWDDWNDFPNSSLIPDDSYVIIGSSSNFDGIPRINPITVHSILPPILLYPFGDEIREDDVHVQWVPAIDSLNQSDRIHYSIVLSYDQGETWEMLASNLNQTDYKWDTSIYSEGTIVRLKKLLNTNSPSPEILTINRSLSPL